MPEIQDFQMRNASCENQDEKTLENFNRRYREQTKGGPQDPS
jgi:hypothetical protein